MRGAIDIDGLSKQSDHNDAAAVEQVKVPFTVTMEIPKGESMWSLSRAQAEALAHACSRRYSLAI